MLYTCANPVLEIVTVGRFSWQSRQLAVQPRSFSALAFRVRGSGSLQWGDKSLYLMPESVLYLPQGVEYSHDYTNTEVLLFHFITAKNDTEPELYTLKNPEEMVLQFQKAISLWEKKEPGYMGKCMSILYKIMGLLAENQAKCHLPDCFLQAVSILNTEYCNSSLRIREVCRRAAIGETAFRELFRKHYGKPPVTYLTELRLEHARNLLSDGKSVETAALESGFSDAKYFSRVVRQFYGCSPRQLYKRIF